MQELKLKTRRVLEAVYNNGGEAITPEIEEQTGIEKSATLRYHAEDVLEERGLVECRVESTEDHPTGVRHVEITEEGRERIGQLFDGTDDVPISKRMSRIEERFDETESHVTELIGEIEDIDETAEFASNVANEADVKSMKAVTASEETQEEVEQLSGKIDHLANRIDRVARYVDKLKEVDLLHTLELIESKRLSSVESRLDKLEENSEQEAESESKGDSKAESDGQTSESGRGNSENKKRRSQFSKIERLLEAERWQRRVRGMDRTGELRLALEKESIKPSERDLKRVAREYDLKHTESAPFE